jgi:uncharacterized coiled-coil protein SlyX
VVVPLDPLAVQAREGSTFLTHELTYRDLRGEPLPLSWGAKRIAHPSQAAEIVALERKVADLQQLTAAQQKLIAALQLEIDQLRATSGDSPALPAAIPTAQPPIDHIATAFAELRTTIIHLERRIQLLEMRTLHVEQQDA